MSKLLEREILELKDSKGNYITKVIGPNYPAAMEILVEFIESKEIKAMRNGFYAGQNNAGIGTGQIDSNYESYLGQASRLHLIESMDPPDVIKNRELVKKHFSSSPKIITWYDYLVICGGIQTSLYEGHFVSREEAERAAQENGGGYVYDIHHTEEKQL